MNKYMTIPEGVYESLPEAGESEELDRMNARAASEAGRHPVARGERQYVGHRGAEFRARAMRPGERADKTSESRERSRRGERGNRGRSRGSERGSCGAGAGVRPLAGGGTGTRRASRVRRASVKPRASV